MAYDVEQIFHERWLGEAQPLLGLTFSIPVLCDGAVMVRRSAAEAAEFSGRVREVAATESSPMGRGELSGDLLALLHEYLGWAHEEVVAGEGLPSELVLRIPEENAEVRPLAAVRRGVVEGEQTPAGAGTEATAAGQHTPASRAGAEFLMLLLEVEPGLSLDKPDASSEWQYPPTAKFERLLRETRVPMGLLSNGRTLRLLYCPSGATGWVSFDVGYMATAAGRDMLSAFTELLSADRVLGAMPGTPTTLELLQQSRERQADVTTQLGAQLLDGLQILLDGFEVAARRDDGGGLRDAVERHDGGQHVYEGLLTVMLRLVFALAAEDRELVPAEHELYAQHLSVGGLYDELVGDEARYPDTMEQRFGAWSRLVMLFRAMYFGVQFGELRMPPHYGRLFNPETFAFIEGRRAGAAAVEPGQRAQIRVPSISDGVVLRVLRRLLVLDGQRLSYSALEEEQLGSVYEGLMGYTIERRTEPSVCLRPSRVWVSPHELWDQPKATRVRWLKDAGVPDSAAKRIAKGFDAAKKEAGGDDDLTALHEALMEVLRRESVAPRGRRGGDDDAQTAEVAAGLVIQPGEERRRTSSHYTPRSLSGPIVARTLEPLLAAMRAKVAQQRPDDPDPQPSSEALLNLKVCDPAMGSGAFLVESCRFLAKQVHAAWVREGVLATMLEEAEGDDVVKRDPEKLAQRMVAQRCLYGVDKNPLAVELGKLSLWLLTLSRGQTFAFLDHCLKAGDSLVGLSRRQILLMDWDLGDGGEGGAAGKRKGKRKKKAEPGVQLDWLRGQVHRAFEQATVSRNKLADLARRGDQAATEKLQHHYHVDAEAALERIRDVADVILSAYFWPYDEPKKLTLEFLSAAKKPSDKDRRKCLRRLADEINEWLRQGSDAGRMPDELQLRRELVREGIRPFHWHLEFPEIFDERREDPLAVGGEGEKVWMDAVVGNPPFAGKNGITATNGTCYLDWLGHAYVPSHGNADLSSYFFRRAHEILGDHGTLGLIATNTIGQGDTRTTGLQPLAVGGARIYDATRSMKWPVKGANVSVSVVHMAVGTADGDTLVDRLDGEVVEAVNSRLRPKPERADPVVLRANAGKSFVGSYVLGKGFVLTPEEREELVAADPRNAERIFPYLGGQELNTSPTQSHDRYVINFGDMSLEEAERWPGLIRILREKVKPERDLNNRASYRKYWWQFAEKRAHLRAALRKSRQCIACSRHSKHAMFAKLASELVSSEALVVLTFESDAHFGLLQSRIHERWARLQGSSLEDRLRYTPSDCFETFPFPPERTLAEGGPLDTVAQRLYNTRAAFMVDTEQGLTKTYNALKDPEVTDAAVVELRALHEELDRAVLQAYGQAQIDAPPYCGASEAQLERFEDEVLDFLFERNEKLAAQERRAAKRA